MKVGIVVSRFNEAVTSRLLSGALEALRTHGLREDAVDVARVPGAFEIPLAAKKMAVTHRYDAVICLGAVIRGETPHFQYIATEAAHGVAETSLTTGIPVSFGILTTEDEGQAMERSGEKEKNKGWEAALSAIEMVNLLKRIEKGE